MPYRLAARGEEIAVRQCSMKSLEGPKTETRQAIICSDIGQTDSDRLRLEDRRISAALVSPFIVLMAQYSVLVSKDLIGTGIGHTIQILSKILVGISFAYALPVVLRRNKRRFLGAYSILTFVFLLHYLMFPENNMYQNQLVFPLFAMCLPAFIYSFAIRDWQALRDVMRKASYIVFSLGLLLGLMVFGGKASIGVYSMPLSYYLLLPAIAFIDESLDRRRIGDILAAFLSVVLILAIGARGPIMCIAAFAILKTMRFPARLRHSHVFAYLCSILLVIMVALFFDELLMSMSRFLSRFGIDSRSIALLLQPGLDLSGRDLLYSRVIAEIMDNPITGIGIGGDRRVLNGVYAHNLLIELVADYGIPLGSLFVLVLLGLMIRFSHSRDKCQRNVFAMWLNISVIPLLVSGSYLESTGFWICLGMLVQDVTVTCKH